MSRHTIYPSDIGPAHKPSVNAQLTRKRIIAAEALKLAPVVKPSKYGAKRCEIDGIKFDSHAEAQVYLDLKVRVRAREITGLECHPRYSLDVNGTHIGFYSPDFRFIEHGKGLRILDVKGGKATQTAASKLRIRLFEAIYSQHVVIITS